MIVAFFSVLGDPVPWSLSRTRDGRVYVSTRVQDWKDAVRAAAVEALRGEPLPLAPGVAVLVDLTFRIRRPRGHLGTGRNADRLKPSAPRHHTSKPDKGNLEKAVLDALGVAGGSLPLVWCDDAQVTRGSTFKRWARPGEEPGVDVAVAEIPC